MSLERHWVPGKVLEAGRVAMSHFLGTEGKVFVRVFPHKPVTATPEETRMGKGKGEPEYYAAVVKPGTILFEVGGVPEDMAREALLRAAHKMPVRVKLARREGK
jgi:large subunit ribosomal protein L16